MGSGKILAPNTLISDTVTGTEFGKEKRCKRCASYIFKATDGSKIKRIKK